MATKKNQKSKKLKKIDKPIKLTDFLGDKNKEVKKPIKKINIESKNIIGEIKEILSPCIKCGMCKSLCPVFKTLKQEEVSPRGHSIMLNEKIINELVYKCNLCKACEKKCPLNLKICDAMKKAREVLVLEEQELEANKEMMESIRNTGSPFKNTGKIDPDKLYCC